MCLSDLFLALFSVAMMHFDEFHLAEVHVEWCRQMKSYALFFGAF